VYEPVMEECQLRERLEMFLSQFNEMVRGVGMDLVFFPDAILHLVKVSYINIYKHNTFQMPSAKIFFPLDIESHTTSSRKRNVSRRRRFWKTIVNKISFFYSWLQDISNSID